MAALVVMYVARRPLGAVTAFVERISDAITGPVWRRLPHGEAKAAPSS